MYLGFDPTTDGMFNPPSGAFDDWSILNHWTTPMTKSQRKDQLRITHWFYGEPFRETSRSKPSVPELSRDVVMNTFIGRDVKGSGMYFTPPEMAQVVADVLDPVVWQGGKVLEPCAGIGHLIAPLGDVHVVAYDICETNVALGSRLFPSVTWKWAIPFGEVDSLRGLFDVVMMNPPFNVKRGMGPGVEMAQGRATKSEYLFLELAIRVVRMGGQIVIVAPYNFWEKMPRRLREWVDERAVLEDSWGPLPGEFSMTKMSVHLFVVRKRRMRVSFVSGKSGRVVQPWLL